MRSLAALFCCSVAVGVAILGLATSSVTASTPISSSSTTYNWDLSWVAGVEYTPARAPGNSLWWYNFDEYKADVERELSAASTLYGFNHLRMFLHNMVYDVDNGAALYANMNTFLDIAKARGFKVSFVFFDDCWNHAGASLEDTCVPVKGRHNGCWMAIPQDVQRTDVDRFKGYVYDTVYKFANDDRVAFWEIFNEPNNANEYSMSLRHTAFQWALDALQDASGVDAANYVQKVPVLSCWDNNIDTQVSDMHRYDTNFVEWTNQVFVGKETMNTLITEGGSRWYQGYPTDAGSPLAVLHWYNHLKAITPSETAPFNFGIVLNWELMVGGSNTRWHWDTPDNSAEPVIPWDAHLFPDGTPVSYVEAAAIRNWTRGVNEFVAFDNFLPDTHAFTEDTYLCLNGVQGYNPTLYKDSFYGSDKTAVIETAVWPTDSVGGGILMVTGMIHYGIFTAYYFGFPDGASKQLNIEYWEYQSVGANGKNSTSSYSAAPRILDITRKEVLKTFDMSTLDCGLVTNGWNLLRAEVTDSVVNVYANPMYPEAASTEGIQPRLSLGGSFSIKDLPQNVMLVGSTSSTSASKATVSADSCARFDYVGVLSKTPRK
jgi:hypothetical protein